MARQIMSRVALPAMAGRARMTFDAGQEDLLARSATMDELTYLTEQGVIAGFEGVEAPTPVRDLAGVLAKVASIEEVRALQAKDGRVSAQTFYERRVTQLTRQAEAAAAAEARMADVREAKAVQTQVESVADELA